MPIRDLLGKLARLGYTPEWISAGMLTEAVLEEQIQAIEKLADLHTEHYRYSTLLIFLTANNPLTTEKLTDYLRLTAADPDVAMGGSATVELLRREKLTDQQFEQVIAALTTYGGWTRKLIVRHRLLRELNREALSEELFERCLTQGDAAVHKLLLNLPVISRDQVQQLVERGDTKNIRNAALELSRRRR